MIIRRSASSQQLITQPEHAALAARIMRQWDDTHFPESSRKTSILHAVEQHDCGWAAIDETLIVHETTGQLLDFLEVSDAIKRDTSSRGIEQLSSDPYAAALVTQHRLHVYRRYSEHPEWRGFMADLTAARDACLHAAGHISLSELVRTIPSCAPAISRHWRTVTTGPTWTQMAADMQCVSKVRRS